MKEYAAEGCRWIYSGLSGMLVDWFRLPLHPPTLPALSGEEVESFRPSPAWLDYLKLKFWLGMIPLGIFLVVGMVGLLIAIVAEPQVGAIVGIPILVFAALVAMLLSAANYLVLHLRYDTTWYVMTSRSLRIRRGVWVLHETTITFENVQNIRIDQGPLERYVGVANLLVETAGGGGGVVSLENAHAAQSLDFHRGLIEGIHNADELREKILARQRRSPGDALGDEREDRHAGVAPAHAPTPGLGSEHMALLREIRALAQQAAGGA